MVRDGTIEEILQLCGKIPEFGQVYEKKEFVRRLSDTDSMILIAEEAGKIVGFKCGYQRVDNTTYYSWMGGVLPSYREKGIALQLLLEMERRVKSMGYKFLSFKTLNEHKSMLIFALKYGFEIYDIESSNKDSRPRIWLKKQL